MTGSAPAVSVVMPVHNMLPFIDASVESILGQSFSDFEFVILDDGCTDGSLERLRAWAARDARIRLIEGKDRSGPVRSSNRVVAEARAPLIARMDADDIAHPDRLRRQIALMHSRPDALLVGSLFDTVDDAGRLVRPPDLWRLVHFSPLPPYAHSTILFRKQAFDRVGGYRSESARWEDIDLSRRMAAAGPILVIPESLMSVRLSDLSSRVRSDRSELDRAMDAMYRADLERPVNSSRPLLPQSFVAAGSLHVWQGHRPRVLRRVLSHGAIRPDWASARVLIWSAWADVSPQSLRRVLKTLAVVRNRIARRRLRGADSIEWRPEITPGSDRAG